MGIASTPMTSLSCGRSSFSRLALTLGFGFLRGFRRYTLALLLGLSRSRSSFSGLALTLGLGFLDRGD